MHKRKMCVLKEADCLPGQTETGWIVLAHLNKELPVIQSCEHGGRVAEQT